MKKIILSLFVFTFSVLIFASEVSDLLQEAQTAYESGDVTTAIQKLDSAKSIMSKEQITASADDYVEVSSWDVVKIKKAEYKGKKIKIRLIFAGIMNDGTVHLHQVYPKSTYDDNLVDRILSLTKYEPYTFYGTVIENYGNPCLHIENVE